MVGFGLYASSSGALVREVFEGAIANYGAPEEVLTDQGPQYHTWRGTSEFARLCARRGIRQVVARARHPQTLGKIERCWGTLWRGGGGGGGVAGRGGARRRGGRVPPIEQLPGEPPGVGGVGGGAAGFSAAPPGRGGWEKRGGGDALCAG